MNKVFALGLLVAVFGVPAGTAKAMPLMPIATEQPRLAIPVADGCGFNRYRDARGICRKKYVITPPGATAFLHRMWRPQFPPRV